MRRIVSLVILVTFVISQNAYGQQSSYPISTPGVEMPRRAIKVNGAFKTAQQQGGSREEAMTEAVMEAERKQAEVIEGEGTEEAISEERIDLRQKRPIAKKELRKIKVKKDGRIVQKINKKIHPFKISGEYQLAWGYDWGDGEDKGYGSIWKYADFNKAVMPYVHGMDNLYLFGRHRENTYDKRVYDRFRLKIESVRERGFNLLSEVVVDPWSFVGKTDFFMISSSTNSQMPLQLRYWSNTQRTLDERIWLTSGNDFVDVPEIRVHDGKTRSTVLSSRWNNVNFSIPEMEINRDFRPLRKLEVNFKGDNINFKIFPLADHDHAYNSDDPLMLSNRHIYWEPSPWLNNWKSSLYFPATGDYRRGKWTNNIAFESRDSDYNFLTLLRGLSFELNYGDTYIGGAVAAPLNLWQDYESVNSLPGALRFKQKLFRNYYVGGIYTWNYGFSEGRVDALNHVIGVDGGYEIPGFVTLRGEYARSMDKIDRHGHDVHITRAKDDGGALKIEAKGEFLKDRDGASMLKVSSSYTRMGGDFRARLSNYRNTRYDQFWGKHISFEPVSPDFNAFRIGDGIDIGRDVYNLRIESTLFRNKFNSLFDMKFISRDFDKMRENIYREEISIRPMDNLIGKFLFRYQHMPKTVHGVDPFIISDFVSEDNTDELMTNDDILGEDEASVWTCSFGFHYDPVKWFGLEGIYERTNDYDIFPQDVLNDASFRDLGNIRELNYYLFDQSLIAIPPYDDYNIYKARIFFRPLKGIRTKFEYVINNFKHATGRDDNISHYGVEVDVDITKRLRSSFKFTRSHLVDLFMQQQRSRDLPYYGHNNIFAQLEYDYDDNNTFVVQFGEFFAPTPFTPIQWLLSTIDTQRIVRFYLKGTF